MKSDLRLVGILSIKDNQLEGFEVDLAKKLSTEIFGKDVQVNFVPVTSNTRMALLKNGNIDALVATMTITPDRQKVVDFSQPYFKAGQTIMVKRDSKIKSVTDLKQGTKVIGLQGSNSVQNIKKVAPFTKILQLPDAAQRFRRSNQARLTP
nr:transporter substrate-binding domain-containing protein [Amylolactobacillus amylophilus]